MRGFSLIPWMNFFSVHTNIDLKYLFDLRYSRNWNYYLQKLLTIIINNFCYSVVCFCVLFSELYPGLFWSFFGCDSRNLMRAPFKSIKMFPMFCIFFSVFAVFSLVLPFFGFMLPFFRNIPPLSSWSKISVLCWHITTIISFIWKIIMYELTMCWFLYHHYRVI